MSTYVDRTPHVSKYTRFGGVQEEKPIALRLIRPVMVKIQMKNRIGGSLYWGTWRPKRQGNRINSLHPSDVKRTQKTKFLG